MIIRERTDTFVMIEQHHHATISAALYDQMVKTFPLEDNTLHESVRKAIYYHDVGWIPFDLSPLWNDVKNAPFSFISYPNSIKTVLYHKGIDKIVDVHPYAGLLCSEHYIRFLANDSTLLAKKFVQDERHRQEEIIATLESYDAENFASHYGLLQFYDNLSLFLCLNEPNTSKEDIHFFFKKGIPLPALYGGGNLTLTWDDAQVTLDEQLFPAPVNISLEQKVVSKKAIHEVGLIEAWKQTPIETVELTIKNC